MMTLAEMEEFQEYLRNCTDAQVEAVAEKEEAAERFEYAALAFIELGKRRNRGGKYATQNFRSNVR